MKQFRNINYGFLLFDTLRGYFSVNSSGSLSILYRYLLACISFLQSPIDSFGLWRENKKLIAGCCYQIGQFANLLNYLYDPFQKRIYITQATVNNLFVPTFDMGINQFVSTFDDDLPAQSNTFDDVFFLTIIATIWIPAAYYMDPIILSQITATIEQVKIQGLDYQIKQI